MCIILISEKESSFTERHRVSLPRTSSFQLYEAGHYGWFLCVGDQISKLRYKMQFLFDDESVKFVRNCSFFIQPTMNCSSVHVAKKNETICGGKKLQGCSPGELKGFLPLTQN